MPTAKPTAAGALSLCARDDGSKMAVVSGSLTFGAARDDDDEEGCLMRSGDDRFSSAYATAAPKTDATISARIMSEGSIRRDYGLLLRVTDDWDDSFRYQPRAGYRCTVNTGRDGKADSTISVEVLREDGSRSTIAGLNAPAFTLEPGTWYAVSGSAIGNHIQCRIFGANGLLGGAGAFDDTYGDGYFATWNYKDDSGPHWWGDLRINDVPPPAARRLRGSR